MRPVDKPAPGNKYDTAEYFPLKLKRGGALYNMLIKIFNEGLKKEFLGDLYWNDAKILLLKIAKKEPILGLDDNRRKEFSELMWKDQIGKIWAKAASPLVDGLGAYCSYCGSPITGLLEVEHTVPKDPYPTFSTDWKNFLPSCGPCNNLKSDNPKRNADIFKDTYGMYPPSTENDYYTAIREELYIWPDLDDTCFQDMIYLMKYNDHGDWKVLDTTLSLNTNNMITNVDYTTHEVTAEIFDNLKSLGKFKVKVVAEAVDTHSKEDRAQNMIDLVELNAINTKGTYDRRVMNRTIAWFHALAAKKIITPIQDPAAFESTWAIVKILGLASGFFDVWMTVLYNVPTPTPPPAPPPAPPPPPGKTLGIRFADETRTMNPGYPNTKMTYL